MLDIIYENFKRHFPRIEEQVVSHHMRGPFELIVELEDGCCFAYYELGNTLHRIPRADELRDENVCRKEFGRLLYRVMYERGITQDDLSKKTGISQHSISKYVTGDVSPSFYNVDKIVRALGCSMDDLRY